MWWFLYWQIEANLSQTNFTAVDYVIEISTADQLDLIFDLSGTLADDKQMAGKTRVQVKSSSAWKFSIHCMNSCSDDFKRSRSLLWRVQPRKSNIGICKLIVSWNFSVNRLRVKYFRTIRRNRFGTREKIINIVAIGRGPSKLSSCQNSESRNAARGAAAYDWNDWIDLKCLASIFEDFQDFRFVVGKN